MYHGLHEEANNNNKLQIKWNGEVEENLKLWK